MSKLLKLSEVMDRTRLSRSSIYAFLGKGGFPKPVKMGERLNVWPEAEIEEWIEARAAER